MSLWLALLALNGCLKEVSPGPDLGACADVPDGTYGYGEAGIGTCLSGPSDLVFFQQDGVDYLAVTNADPYREFRSGSVLIIKWYDPAHLDVGDPESGVTSRLQGDPPKRLVLSDLNAWAREIIDDDDEDGEGGNPYLGGFGYLQAHQAAVVTSRLTEALTARATQNGLLRVGKDELYMLDLSRLAEGQIGPSGDDPIPELRLEDDPFPVVVDDDTSQVYVGNLTDHSISVLTSASEDALVEKIDVAPGATTTKAPFRDSDGSGSRAVVSTLAVDDPKAVIEDRWTLTFVEGTVRAWVPTPVSETVGGLARWSTGNATDFVPSPFGFELGLGDVTEPFIEKSGSNNVLYFTEKLDGGPTRIRRAFTPEAGQAGSWALETLPLLDRALYGSPCVAPLPGEVGLYVDLRESTMPGALAEIALARSPDGLSFGQPILVLPTPPPDPAQPAAPISFEDPFVALDSLTGTYRMWLSRRQAGRYEIALAESVDGLDWSEPRVVLSDPDRSLAAPTVGVLEGRYGMWFARDEGFRWDHFFSWSYDGITWSQPERIIEGQSGELDVPAYDPYDPPRMAVLVDRIGGWRIEGENTGITPSLLTAGTAPLPLLGFEIGVANGQELDNSVVPDGRANLAIVPGAALTSDDGRKLLFATTVGSQIRSHLALFEEAGDTFDLVRDPVQMREALGLKAGEFASDPVVVPDGEGYVLYFTLWADGTGRLRSATSEDGVNYGPASSKNVLPDEGTSFDAASERAHSVELLSDGRVRLWYTGYDGSVSRIGSATAPSPTGRFARDPGLNEEWKLGPGLPGGFDDSSVQDPLVVKIGEETHLYYAGSDGLFWSIGHATLSGDNVVRETDELTALGRTSLSGTVRTFSAAGIDSPVLWSDDGETIELLYAGFDGGTRRVGRATLQADRPEVIFATQQFPTAGDELSFGTTRGGPGAQVIELAQTVDTFTSLGIGMSSIALDSERGFLYVTTKLDDVLFVLDVRDDSSGTFVDSNFLDLETLVVLDLGDAQAGIRDVMISPERGLAYLSLRSPDGLAILDLTRIPDDAMKEQLVLAPATIIAMQSSSVDAGVDTVARFAGGRGALTQDEQLLLLPHFRGNGLSIFDLGLSTFGQEIAWLPNIGENPHVVKISPDGQWAVVANYLGEVVDGSVSSTLAVVSLDPSSENYLEVVTWLTNK